MSKPNWNESPSWANYLAQDRDGEWCWWNAKPVMSLDLWTHDNESLITEFSRASYGPSNQNWFMTLESRP